MTNCKEGSIGKAGMLLYHAHCTSCKQKHQQWFYPCDNDCEDGRIPVDPLGYTTCPVCRGRGYKRD